MAKNNLMEALIGLVVLAVSVLFVMYVYANTDAGRSGGTVYKASFAAADGLALGADVKIAGVKVGTVVSQKLNPTSYRANVEFTVNSDVKLAEDSAVKISSEGLLGGTYLKIVPGGALDDLQAGDEFEQTQSAVDLIDLVSRAVFASGGDDDEPEF